MFACLSRQGGATGRSTGPERKVVIRTDRIDAVIFDMDGVVTDTAGVHAAAWARLFDRFLGDRAAIIGKAFRPFTVDDYRRFVDGKPRYAGVRSFLATRGITLPEGDPSDPPDRQTVFVVDEGKGTSATSLRGQLLRLVSSVQVCDPNFRVR